MANNHNNDRIKIVLQGSEIERLGLFCRDQIKLLS